MNKRSGILLGTGIAAGALLVRKFINKPVEQSLTGEVVLITGGSRGLGLALAREFSRSGCRIAICSRDLNELDRAVADLELRGADVLGVPCDVSKEDEVASLLSVVTHHFGGVDILVNNAGVIEVGPAQTMKPEDFKESMNTIFWGMLYPTLAALPAFLARQSGRIVNINSIAGEVSVPQLLPYTSAKFAAAGFSQGLAAELRPHGITVTTIYPGLMRTGSSIQAKFKGNRIDESNWFTLASGLPILSMDADRAARQIIRAVKLGSTQRILSLPAQLLSRLNKISPIVMSDILSVVSSLLPEPSNGDKAVPGKKLVASIHPAVRILANLGFRAMRSYNQQI